MAIKKNSTVVTASTLTAPSTRVRPWCFLLLALALIWVGIARLPLIRSASVILNSDLAVDGLTLVDLVHGRWHWHFPGTPYLGIAPALLCLPTSKLFGVTPATLVIGAVLGYEFLVVSVFFLTRQVFGRSVANWSLLPLAFSSTGVLWLSSQVSGSHFFIAAWWGISLYLLYELIKDGALWKAGLLGIWSGVGLWVDSSFLYCLIGILTAFFVWKLGPGSRIQRFLRASLLTLGLASGGLLLLAGYRTDPYDAYANQHQTLLSLNTQGRIDWKLASKVGHQNLSAFALECVPRLVTGYWFVTTPGIEGIRSIRGLQTESEIESLKALTRRQDLPHWNLIAIAVSSLGFLMLACAVYEVINHEPMADHDQAPHDLLFQAMITTSFLIIGSFLSKSTIIGSESYRYLTLLLVPYSVGTGLWFERLSRTSTQGLTLSRILAATIMSVFTVDLAAGYGHVGLLGTAQPNGQVVRQDPAEIWLKDHPEAEAIFGSYWDVYRLSFLTGGRVKGVPYPDEPNRFPESTDWRKDDRPSILLARDTARGRFYHKLAQREGAKLLAEWPGLWILDWPVNQPARPKLPAPQEPAAPPDELQKPGSNVP